MVLCRGVDLWAEAHVLLERSFAHLFFFEMGGACFKQPGPVTFASGGVGTDFTRRCDKKMGGYGFFLHRRLVLDRIRSRATVRDLNEVLLS